MKKNVIVSVSGTHMAIGSEEPIEIVAGGTYYKRNGKIYIKYNELSEEGELDCMIKADSDIVEITKKGAYSSCLIFDRNKCCMTPYYTPFGALMIETTTKDLILLEDSDILIIKIKYSLGINYEHVAMCNVDIKVVSAS